MKKLVKGMLALGIILAGGLFAAVCYAKYKREQKRKRRRELRNKRELERKQNEEEGRRE